MYGYLAMRYATYFKIDRQGYNNPRFNKDQNCNWTCFNVKI